VRGYDSTQSIYRLGCQRIKAQVRRHAAAPVHSSWLFVFFCWWLISIVAGSVVHPNVVKMVKQIKSMVIECCDWSAVCIGLGYLRKCRPSTTGASLNNSSSVRGVAVTTKSGRTMQSVHVLQICGSS